MNTDAPINLQSELVQHLIQRRKRKYKVPEIGIYYPSVLTQSCVRGQWNFYKMSMAQGQLPDTFILKTAEGDVWHELMEELRVWDSVEGSAVKRILLEDGSPISIRGRYDAMRGDTVYDFKRVEFVPWRKAKFEHILQCLQRNQRRGKSQMERRFETMMVMSLPDLWT